MGILVGVQIWHVIEVVRHCHVSGETTIRYKIVGIYLCIKIEQSKQIGLNTMRYVINAIPFLFTFMMDALNTMVSVDNSSA